ncbi:MAG: hypothetical protein ACI8Z9_001310 [Paraglaciecola sp.]
MRFALNKPIHKVMYLYRGRAGPSTFVNEQTYNLME